MINYYMSSIAVDGGDVQCVEDGTTRLLSKSAIQSAVMHTFYTSYAAVFKNESITTKISLRTNDETLLRLR